MNPIFQALNSGYSPQDVLKYFMKAIPQMAPSIKKAQRAGYQANQILGFLSKSFETEDRAGMSESERHAVNRRADAERTKHGLKIAGSVVATPLIASAAQSALARALPSSVQGLIPQQSSNTLGSNNPTPPTTPGAIHPLNTGLAPNQQALQQGMQQSSSPQLPLISQNLPSSLPQTSQPIQPEGISNPKEYLEKLGVLEKVDQLLDSGNTPKAAAAVLGMTNKKGPASAKIDPELESVVEEYAKTKATPDTSGITPENISIEKTENIKASEPATIQKQSIVASPQGAGQVKEIRNGKALIEIDGKKHVIDEDELIQSPLPEKDLADLFDDLISGIEKETKQQVSRNVDWSGYDPISNELAYKPHGSDKLYVYEDISPEDVELLTSLLTQRKSTGSNFVGAWEAGSTSPIGAAMYQLIKRLQAERGGKGNEYKNKYETIYDALEPAKLAAKKKHAEKKKKAKKPGIN